MTTNIDYGDLKDGLIIEYAKRKLASEKKAVAASIREIEQSVSLPVVKSLHTLSNCLARYDDPNALDKALDAIDLANIYENVERRERESTNPALSYDDFVVLE